MFEDEIENEDVNNTPDIQVDDEPAIVGDEPALNTDIDDDGEPGDPAVPEVPAYTPNLKFKVKDQEMEFDEIFRPLATSAEAEAKIREFHEKYHGIDEVKKHRDEIRQSFETYRQNYEPVLHNIQSATHAYHRNDIEGTFEALGVDKNKVLEWARREQALETLSPQARAEYDRQRQVERESYGLQQQVHTGREQLNQLRREAKISEINTALTSPDVMGLQEAFDQKLGQGSFKAELIRRGKMHQAQTGEDKSASAVVAEMIQLFGHMRQTSAPAQTPSQAAAPQQAKAPLKKQVQVIPVTKTSGTAQVKSRPKTIEEMIKMRDAGQL